MSKKKKRQQSSSRVTESRRLVGSVTEEHGEAAYSVSFWPGENAAGESSYVAVVAGGNRVSVYEIGESSINLRQSYVDEDESEIFYASCWSHGVGTNGSSPRAVLAVGGHQGIAKLIDCEKYELNLTLAGHGNAINDMCFHSVDSALLLTASKDESIRLWNVNTARCVAIFAGDRGHRDEVLSVDVHLLGGVFTSSGMDNTVKVWRLDSEKVAAAIRSSHAAGGQENGAAHKTAFEQFPIFSTANVHSNYVDCVRWAGSLLFSKSTANRIILWTPDPHSDARTSLLVEGTGTQSHTSSSVRRGSHDDSVLILSELELQGADIWFMRFALDLKQEYLAAGNKSGCVYVWNIDSCCASDAPFLRLSHPKCISAVRQVSFSPDSRLVACSCDDSSVWIYDISAYTQPLPGGPTCAIPSQPQQKVKKKQTGRDYHRRHHLNGASAAAAKRIEEYESEDEVVEVEDEEIIVSSSPPPSEENIAIIASRDPPTS